MFEDRADAGRRLAVLVDHLREEDPIVIGLPRGGVIVAREIARHLGAPLDVLVARKLGAPGHAELGIGAIAPGGVRVLDPFATRYLGITESYLAEVTAREEEEMRRRMRAYRGEDSGPDVAGRTVILVDDGLATGVTARAAIQALKQKGARRIVLAVPVCAPETAESLRAETAEVICAEMPPEFRAVGLWYRDFRQVEDEEVLEALASARASRPPAV